MAFLDIKDPAERANVIKEYFTAMKTVKQHVVNWEMKLAIGDELQTLFHPIVNATKQGAEETRKELAPVKKMLTDIDRALTAQHATDARPRQDKNVDTTFGLFQTQDGKLGMGNKVLHLDGKTLSIDDTKYKLTPGLLVLITKKHSQAGQWNYNDYKAYKSLVAQNKVKSFPNRPGNAARPHAKWKWKRMLKKMAIPGERIAEEESEDTDDTDSVESYPDIASIGDIDRTAPGMLTSDSDISSPGMSPSRTRSHGKAKKTKDREPFYKGYGLV